MAAVGDPINASQHYRPQRNEVGNPLHHAAGIFGQGSVADFFGGRVAEVFDLHAGKNEDAGSANLMQSINAVQVVRGILANALLGFADEVFAIAELGCARGANFGACGLLSGGNAVRAHNAFAHPRIQRSPFVLGLAEGTGGHAVTASDALPHVVDHGAFWRLVEGSDGADRGTGGMFAMHAQAAHELVAAGHDGGVLVLRLLLFGGDGIVVGELVLGGAGLLTLLAADAEGGII